MGEVSSHGDEEIEQFRGRSMLARTGYRAALIEKALAEAGYDLKDFAAVGGRGGLLPPMACGTYLVDNALVEELRLARRGEHACNLGAVSGPSLRASRRGQCLYRGSGHRG